jgi:Flp pilus assembly protein TadG
MRILRGESGQTVAVFAFFMAFLGLGFMAFAIDAGLLFEKKRVAQSAADAAAMAAAVEVAAGSGNQQTVANAVATINGMNTSQAVNPATVTLSTPSTGNFTGSTYVQATVTQPIKTTFLAAIYPSHKTIDVSATAIAGGGNASSTCICLEGTSGDDLLMNNGSSISAPSCGVVDNSTSSNAIEMYGGATLNALSLGTVSSDWDNSSNIYGGASISGTTKIVQGISNGCSATLPAAPSYGSCASTNPGGASGNFVAGPTASGGTICYGAGLTIGSNGATTTMNAGIYVINGGYLTFDYGANNVSNTGANGVMFYLINGASLVIQNGANINLTAGGNTTKSGGTSTNLGAYNGILVYQPASNTSAVTVQGGASSYINGSFYAPGAAVTLDNGTGTTVYGDVVAQTLTMAGGATLSASPTTNQGSLTISSPKLVQ